MRIPSSTNAPARPAEGNKSTERKNVNADNASDESGAMENVSGGERDFASVLDEVARPGGRQEAQEESGVQRDAKLRDTVEGEGETHRREDRDESGSGGGDAKGGGFDGRGGVREVANTHDAAGARAILHIADLERIVSAVRTQALTGGRRELTIDLRRSVLEGLRIKLSTDERGRVTAEFIASSERVRAQLDARSNELAEVLRARGINLESLRTSVGADDGDNRSTGGEGRSFETTEAISASRPATDIQTPARNAEVVTGDADGDGSTYRA